MSIEGVSPPQFRFEQAWIRKKQALITNVIIQELTPRHPSVLVNRSSLTGGVLSTKKMRYQLISPNELQDLSAGGVEPAALSAAKKCDRETDTAPRLIR